VATELPPPASFLKHADEQSVAGLAAVHRAIGHRLAGVSFADWGVVAAPELLGQTVMGPTLQRFAQEGAWGISPHLIPHRSLHSVSGTISQALGLHGPNFGVGGGPGAVSEAFLAAASLIAERHVPGLWLVLTKGIVDTAAASTTAGVTVSHWLAVALALTPPREMQLGLLDHPEVGRLHVGVGNTRLSNGATGPAWPQLRLEALADALGADDTQPRHWRLSSGGSLRLQPRHATVEVRT
jgi:hypothetical protein